MLTPWRKAVLGESVLVRTVDLEPSHWIVPVLNRSKVLGYVEVARDGRVSGHAYFYQNPQDLGVCPSVVTRITSEEAFRQAQKFLNVYVDAEFSEPVFVVNGLRNQLAWMIEVRMGGELKSRVFVTPGYVYERKLGEKPPPPGLRGGGNRQSTE